MTRRLPVLILVAGLAALPVLTRPALAQDDAFESGWTLVGDSSSLSFQSVKKTTVVEQSGFATFSGSIDENGLATVTVLLDSVDTKIDLRNVRMRFLFFETFLYPQATVTAQLSEADLAELNEKRRKVLQLPFTLDLHGVKRDLVADVAVTLISSDIVAASSVTPISIAAADFNLLEGITKLQEAAQVDIIPSGSVTFDFLFARNVPGDEMVVAGIAQDDDADDDAEEAEDDSDSVALEAEGNFDTEACVGRFEILSRSGNIFFAPASARLDQASGAILSAVADIVSRCPGMVIEIGGHTDSDGSDATNQVLSERRAQAVADDLTRRGVPAERFVTRGYGESAPFIANDSSQNKARNRRIEFKVLSTG